MTKETFTARPYMYKTISAFFALASFIFLFTTYRGFIHIKFIPTPFNEFSGYFLAFLGIILAYIFWFLPLQEIEVDELGIKQLYKKNKVSKFISHFINPDVKCEWSWIHSVGTTRRQDGALSTVLYLSEAVPNQPKDRVVFDSFTFKNYVSILRIIKERAPQANLDEMTSLILRDQIDIRAVRPFIWWLAIITILIGLIYDHYIKG